MATSVSVAAAKDIRIRHDAKHLQCATKHADGEPATAIHKRILDRQSFSYTFMKSEAANKPVTPEGLVKPVTRCSRLCCVILRVPFNYLTHTLCLNKGGKKQEERKEKLVPADNNDNVASHSILVLLKRIFAWAVLDNSKKSQKCCSSLANLT